MAGLVSIDDQFVYIAITKKMITGSIFKEMGRGKFEYKRKGKRGTDELIVTLPNSSKVTYKLDFRSKLMYENLSDRVIRFKGSVKNRQPVA